ncbi:C4-dicarboxylate ABC transporter substrate-binding protein [Tardiphaga alba]|uniref:C4-dicarboxylate ABC transporter substrate-binding protein n=1 Tax=Tardiphaga alba TaxID=340268 RepID=A0ABX8A6Q7_9BRAD|nr:TAXI family TRAP transporter solute-binding subunit [Tardiphaga alba]QUS38095.1 C4-dicarboxylate ABC transporter substrate-binding protein [Tardiphaga alba]
MKSMTIAFPFWGRVLLVAGLFGLALGACLLVWRYVERPTTLSLAVGSLDGEAGRTASIIASHFADKKSTIRLNIERFDDVVASGKAFAEGKADLAVIRADVGDLSAARSVAVLTKGVAMLLAPPGSRITSVEGLRGRTVGVVGGEVNRRLAQALTKQYDLSRANVTFKDVAIADARRAIEAKEVGAVLVVIPLTEKYLTYVRGLFKGAPVLIPIDAAGAIADADGAYESFDIPKGTLRGAPPVPDDDVTTLRVGYYLVANKKLHSTVVANLTGMVISARRDLVASQPQLSGVAAANTDPDAYIPVHPGAAAYYNGTEQSFMDKYGDDIYLAPMILGALASVLAAAWRFLGIRTPDRRSVALTSFDAIRRRIKDASSETELAAIEDEFDELLNAHLAAAICGGDDALDAPTLLSAAQRLDNLIHHRRTAFASGHFTPGPLQG